MFKLFFRRYSAQHRNPVIEAEARANNQTYQNLKEELKQKYLGKWIVSTHGQLQGVGDSIVEHNHLASEAKHRIVMQVGQQHPQQVELGWQCSFSQLVGHLPAKTSSPRYPHQLGDFSRKLNPQFALPCWTGGFNRHEQHDACP